MTNDHNERAAKVWREATLEHWQKTNPHDYGNADTEAARNREADQAATAVIAADRARLEAENARLREALEAEDAYWAASRAHACALPRLSEQSGFVFQAARDRRDAARAALKDTNA